MRVQVTRVTIFTMYYYNYGIINSQKQRIDYNPLERIVIGLHSLIMNTYLIPDKKTNSYGYSLYLVVS